MDTTLEQSNYQLKALIRNNRLLAFSNYFQDFWFDTQPDVIQAVKENNKTDEEVIEFLRR